MIGGKHPDLLTLADVDERYVSRRWVCWRCGSGRDVAVVADKRLGKPAVCCRDVAGCLEREARRRRLAA